MRALTGILAAGLIVSGAAVAQAETQGWYVGAEGGIGIHPDQKVKDNGVSDKVKYDDIGYGVLGQGGYGFGPVRVEGELGWRTVDVDKIAGASSSGNTDAYSIMGNAYYDIPTGTAFTPFIGAGIGAAYVDADKMRLSNGATLNGNEWNFAYQGIAGVAYAINPNLDLKADYRYFATLDNDVKATDGRKYSLGYEAHSVMVGFTYKFGQPAPAPVAAAAPVPAPAPAPVPAPAPKAAPAPMPKSFIVFFDFDKTNVSPEGSSIISKAATSAKQGNVTRVELTGHADRSGSDKYNLALSQKRAEAVKAELVRQGIPANAITVTAKGESAPLVATQDGVREPQNRRVEIVLP